jgi:hypothetical protein
MATKHYARPSCLSRPRDDVQVLGIRTGGVISDRVTVGGRVDVPARGLPWAYSRRHVHLAVAFSDASHTFTMTAAPIAGDHRAGSPTVRTPWVYNRGDAPSTW